MSSKSAMISLLEYDTFSTAFTKQTNVTITRFNSLINISQIQDYSILIESVCLRMFWPKLLCFSDDSNSLEDEESLCRWMLQARILLARVSESYIRVWQGPAFDLNGSLQGVLHCTSDIDRICRLCLDSIVSGVNVRLLSLFVSSMDLEIRKRNYQSHVSFLGTKQSMLLILSLLACHDKLYFLGVSLNEKTVPHIFIPAITGKTNLIAQFVQIDLIGTIT